MTLFLTRFVSSFSGFSFFVSFFSLVFIYVDAFSFSLEIIVQFYNRSRHQVHAIIFYDAPKMFLKILFFFQTYPFSGLLGNRKAMQMNCNKHFIIKMDKMTRIHEEPTLIAQNIFFLSIFHP